jgi:SPW repeat-containing protein
MAESPGEARVGARWQDWVTAIAGLYAALCPLWTETSQLAIGGLVGIGALMFASSAWSLVRPGAVGAEYIHVALGVLLGVAPWLLDYVDYYPRAAFSSWLIGGLAVLLGLWAAPASERAHRMLPRH